MYTIDTSSFFHFFQTLWSLATGAMRLDPAAFTAMDTPGTGLLAATILFLAGVSEALGQSVVLLANRVKPCRFVLSLLINGILFIVSAVILLASIFGFVFLLVLKYTLGRPFIALEHWIRRTTAGVSSTVEVKDLVEKITEQIAENPKGGKS